MTDPPTSLAPPPGRVSPWREARVAVTELAAIAAILTLTLKGQLEGHYAILGFLAVLMRSLTPFTDGGAKK